MLINIFKLFKLELLFMKYNLKAMLQYKTSYFLSIIYELLEGATSLVYYYFIFGKIDNLAGWTQVQLLLLTVYGYFINTVCVMFFIGMVSIPDYIRSGTLDLLLLKPVNKRFLLTFRRPNTVQIINVGISIIVFICYFVFNKTKLEVILIFIFASILSITIMYSIFCTFVSLSFWFIKIGSAWTIIEDMNLMATKPDKIYPKGLRLIMTFFIPSLAIVNMPIKYLVEHDLRLIFLQLFPLTIFFILLSKSVFKLGLKKYSSAGG